MIGAFNQEKHFDVIDRVAEYFFFSLLKVEKPALMILTSRLKATKVPGILTLRGEIYDLQA